MCLFRCFETCGWRRNPVICLLLSGVLWSGVGWVFAQDSLRNAPLRQRMDSVIKASWKYSPPQTSADALMYIQLLTQGTQLAEKLGDEVALAILLYRMALVYEADQDDLEKAAQLLNRAEEIAVRKPIKLAKALIHNLQASILEKQHHYEAALRKANQSLEDLENMRPFTKKSTERHLFLPLRTRARIYHRLQKHEAAIADLKAGLTIILKPPLENGDTVDLNDTYVELTRIYLETGNHAAVLPVLAQWKPLLNVTTMRFSYRYWHEAHGITMKKLGRSCEAADSWETAHRVQAEDAEAEQKRQVLEARTRFEVYQSEAEKRILVAENQQKNLYVILLIVGLIGSGAASGFFYNQTRLKRMLSEKKNAELTRQLEIAGIQKAEAEAIQRETQARHLLQAEENRNKLLQLELTAHEAEKQHRQLAHEVVMLSHRLLERKATLNRILDKIEEILDEKPAARLQKIRLLKNQITTELVAQDPWEEHRQYLEPVYGTFISRLQTQYHLTPHDIRLCVYLKMNLDSPAICELLNIQADSLKNARVRLRKKFDLAKTDSLTAFLHKISLD
jgi:hypothetical protein